MGLMSRSLRPTGRALPRSRDKVRPNVPGNKNRRDTVDGKRFSLPFKMVMNVFAWLGMGGMAIGLLVGTTVGLLYGYRYLTNAQYFSLKTLEVVGNFRLTSREVLDIAGLQPGMNALTISIDEVERNLSHNAWIRTVAVKRTLPDALTILVTEKEPRFWVRNEGALYYADALGRPIVAVSPGRFASFPTLEIEPGAEDMTARLPELLGSLAKARLPVNSAAISLVRLSYGKGVEVFLENNGLVFSIGHEDWRDNLQRLAVTLADLARRDELRAVWEVRVYGSRVWVIKKSRVTVG